MLGVEILHITNVLSQLLSSLVELIQIIGKKNYLKAIVHNFLIKKLNFCFQFLAINLHLVQIVWLKIFYSE